MYSFTNLRKIFLSTCAVLALIATADSAILATIRLAKTATHRLAEVTIAGKVLSSDNNEPIPGVNVLVKGTKIGTSTKADGTFQIKVSSEIF